jgi:nucleoside-diphosphate-sugar epimerase
MDAPLLVTGGTGALGPALIAELLAIQDAPIIVLVRPGPRGERGSRRLVSALNDVLPPTSARRRSLDRLQIFAGDITEPQLGLRPADAELARTSKFIVHAAADTRFGLAASELHHTNVTGTRNVVSFARQCARLEQLLFVSTTCVAGTRTGSIAERLEPTPAFVNAYESSKWCAEQLLARLELPTRIVRLSTCLGDAATGTVHRFGAIHHVMKWMMQALLPMLPAAEGSRFDVIATDVAARWIARALTRSPNGVEVCHVAAGVHAVPVRDLLDCTVTSLRELIPAWKNHQIEPPAVVDAATFARFERTVTQSGDRLFRQVLASASAFLPALLYPKVFETQQSERVWGGPLPLSDWRTTLHRVLAFGAAGGWRPRPASEYAHV